LVSVGSAQIPNLSTFCPEASKTFRDIFFIVEGNEGTAGTTDATLNLALDAEGADADFSHENGLNSACWYRRIWKRTDMTTNATHDLKAAVSSTAGFTFNHLTVTLVVTYEYSEDSSTSILNSLMIPLPPIDEVWLGASATGDKTRMQVKFFVEEPATVALVQSGVYVTWSIDTSQNLSVAAGGQTARAYTGAAGTLTCGGFNVMQRVDSGGAQGAGFTLARGENTFTLDLFGASTTQPHSNVQACLILNYTSGKSASGAKVHNQTTIWSIGLDYAADSAFRLGAAAAAPVIPETQYWTNSVGFRAFGVILGSSLQQAWSLTAERASGEGVGAGWASAFLGVIRSDSEAGVQQAFGLLTHEFDRYPNDLANRMDLETTRTYRMDSLQASWVMAYMLLTHHSIKFTTDDLDIDGYADADGAGLVLNVFRTDTGERLYQFTSGANGVTDTVIYDNVLTYAAEIQEDATHVGRSPNFTPSGSP
jgi:hypothetical protein